jgi:phenylacetate-coenzyme A ligase PaaK-like adenylate-forming protein
VLHNVSIIDASRLLNAKSDEFDSISLQLFKHQYQHCEIYHQYCNALHVQVEEINKAHQIPFLPISFFKSHEVICGKNIIPELVFESSGTTGAEVSKHFVADKKIYISSLIKGFEHFYGSVDNYVILALLPSYLERKTASLVYMAKTLMEMSNKEENGFYIDEFAKLRSVLSSLEADKRPVLLLGVTFALLDFAEKYPMPLQHTVVMETGGMKGRTPEITRAEVHQKLKASWQLREVHSEYGMTELLSQAYSNGLGIFRPSPTMKVLVREIHDPLTVLQHGTGSLNIIDLANVNSCSFIATEDVGMVYSDGSFEVTGRMDKTALRGCNLMFRN